MISQRTHLKLCVEKERSRDKNGEKQRSNGHSQALTYGLNTYCWFHVIVNLVLQPRKGICYFMAYMKKKLTKVVEIWTPVGCLMKRNLSRAMRAIEKEEKKTHEDCVVVISLHTYSWAIIYWWFRWGFCFVARLFWDLWYIRQITGPRLVVLSFFN